MSDQNRYAPFAKETALCVDFAYDAFQDDIRAELEHSEGSESDALKRLLQKVQARRAVLDSFLKPSKAA